MFKNLIIYKKKKNKVKNITEYHKTDEPRTKS